MIDKKWNESRLFDDGFFVLFNYVTRSVLLTEWKSSSNSFSVVLLLFITIDVVFNMIILLPVNRSIITVCSKLYGPWCCGNCIKTRVENSSRRLLKMTNMFLLRLLDIIFILIRQWASIPSNSQQPTSQLKKFFKLRSPLICSIEILGVLLTPEVKLLTFRAEGRHQCSWNWGQSSGCLSNDRWAWQGR